MAKIAGRKNDGAWFRMNQFLLKAQASVRTNFASQLMASTEFTAAFDAIQGYIVEVGVGSGTFPSTTAQWASSLSLGIPRQIWDGVTTYDYYQRQAQDGGGFKYLKQMQPTIFKLSVFIRELSKSIRFGSEEVGWLSSLTRPEKSQSAVRAALPLAERQTEVERIRLHLESEEGKAEVQRIRSVRAAIAEKRSLTASVDESISFALQPRQSQPRRRRPEAVQAPA